MIFIFIFYFLGKNFLVVYCFVVNVLMPCPFAVCCQLCDLPKTRVFPVMSVSSYGGDPGIKINPVACRWFDVEHLTPQLSWARAPRLVGAVCIGTHLS